MNPTTTCLQRPPSVVVTTLAWGDDYIERLLNFTLPALLAPGNYPCLAAEFPCELVIVTEARQCATIQGSEIIQRFAKLGRIRVTAMDDLIVDAASYGFTLTQAFFRVIKEFGSEMVNTYFLFLNADFILADDCYRSLVPLIRADIRVICAPSYCAIETHVLPLLSGRRRNGIISIPKREMAALILQNLHDAIKGQVVEGNFHYDHVYIYQAYVLPDSNTLLGHQMPIAVVALRPTVHIDSMSTFWDWGVVSELCPASPPRVLGDSDDFTMLELRGAQTGAELLRLGPLTPEKAAERLGQLLTRDQLVFGKYLLSLHALDLPEDARPSLTALGHYRERLLQLLPKEPVEHRDHPNWKYHYNRYIEHSACRPRDGTGHQGNETRTLDRNSSSPVFASYLDAVQDIADELANKVLRRASAGEFMHLFRNVPNKSDALEYQSVYARTLRMLSLKHCHEWIESELHEISSSLDQTRAMTLLAARDQTLCLDGLAKPRVRQPTGKRSISVFGIAKSISARLFGSPPHVSMHHPLWPLFRRILHLLNSHVDTATKALIISDLPASPVQNELWNACAKAVRISVANSLSLVPLATEKFDICYCELPVTQLKTLGKIVANISEAMAANGVILVFVKNDALTKLPADDPEFIRGMFPRNGRTRVHYTGSTLSARTLKNYHISAAAFSDGSMSAIALSLLASLKWAALAYKANRLEARRGHGVEVPPWDCCTSITMEITLSGQR